MKEVNIIVEKNQLNDAESLGILENLKKELIVFIEDTQETECKFIIRKIYK